MGTVKESFLVLNPLNNFRFSILAHIGSNYAHAYEGSLRMKDVRCHFEKEGNPPHNIELNLHPQFYSYTGESRQMCRRMSTLEYLHLNLP